MRGSLVPTHPSFQSCRTPGAGRGLDCSWDGSICTALGRDQAIVKLVEEQEETEL